MDRVRPDPHLGFYGPDSMMWRINREAVLLGAGPCALLLQIAHPSVARGVAEHSNFESDPFSRLRGTIKTTMDLVFGNGVVAERAVKRLNGVHAGVRGEGYRALDPQLLLWVQVTLIVTSVSAYERWVSPLTEGQKDEFWQEARTVGPRLGIPTTVSPASWSELTRYWDDMLALDGPIHATETARRLSPLILRPPLPVLPAPIIDVLGKPGLSLLPTRLRDEFRISWTARDSAVAETASVAVKAWTSVVPGPLRWMPQANAAYARARASRPAS
jgi:uncharacterized protein (DUF2236 family)